MEKIMIINASPRAPKSNSQKYAALFEQYSRVPTQYFNLTKKNHADLCSVIKDFSDLLFVFPLYADGIPSTLLWFLKSLQEYPLQHKPVVSVLINCGFIEPEQNDVAVEMVRLFCEENGYPFGSVLRIGSGEAILATPFQFLVRRKIKKLAKCVATHRRQNLRVTMPITKKMFLRASTIYWVNYGKKNGITKEQMECMQIENGTFDS